MSSSNFQIWISLNPSLKIMWVFWLLLLIIFITGLVLGLNRYLRGYCDQFEIKDHDEINQYRKKRNFKERLEEIYEKNTTEYKIKTINGRFKVENNHLKLIIEIIDILIICFNCSPNIFRPLVNAIMVSFFPLLIFSVINIYFEYEKFAKDKPIGIMTTGIDGSGREATYKIIILSAEYFWKKGKTDVVVNSEGNEIDFKQKLNNNGINNLLKESSDVIAVGTASCIGGSFEEDTRGYDRARNIIGWLRELPFDKKLENLYLLNLGKYAESCEESTSREFEQRIVLIVSVIKKQEGVDIRQSFRNAMEHLEGPLLRIDITKYKNWSEKNFKLEQWY